MDKGGEPCRGHGGAHRQGGRAFPGAWAQGARGESLSGGMGARGMCCPCAPSRLQSLPVSPAPSASVLASGGAASVFALAKSPLPLCASRPGAVPVVQCLQSLGAQVSTSPCAHSPLQGTPPFAYALRHCLLQGTPPFAHAPLQAPVKGSSPLCYLSPLYGPLSFVAHSSPRLLILALMRLLLLLSNTIKDVSSFPLSPLPPRKSIAQKGECTSLGTPPLCSLSVCDSRVYLHACLVDCLDAKSFSNRIFRERPRGKTPFFFVLSYLNNSHSPILY